MQVVLAYTTQEQRHVERRGDRSITGSHPKNITTILNGKQRQNATMFRFWSANSTSVYYSHVKRCLYRHLLTKQHYTA